MIINRVWAMPNKNTFSIKPIYKLIDRLLPLKLKQELKENNNPSPVFDIKNIASFGVIVKDNYGAVILEKEAIKTKDKLKAEATVISLGPDRVVEAMRTALAMGCDNAIHVKTSEEDLKKLIGSYLVIEQAYDALSQFNWSEPELIAYDQEIKRIRDNIAAFDYQLDKAKAEGMEKGKAERDIEIAKNLLLLNIPLDTISSSTGLSLSELQKLKSSS